MREQRMIKPCMQRFNEALTCEHVNVRDYNPQAGHSGSNLASIVA